MHFAISTKFHVRGFSAAITRTSFGDHDDALCRDAWIGKRFTSPICGSNQVHRHRNARNANGQKVPSAMSLSDGEMSLPDGTNACGSHFSSIQIWRMKHEKIFIGRGSDWRHRDAGLCR
jgi:hypothetical protein